MMQAADSMSSNATEAISAPARSIHPVVIVGAGISGLALAYRLKRKGIHATILDSASRIAETWRRRHRQLRLNTHRHFSQLPGLPLPRGAGPFASCTAVIRYLEAYEKHLCTAIEFGVCVHRIDHLDGHWRLQTTVGELLARQVVVATGRERVPLLPHWPGLEGFTGKLLHAADFGDIENYRDYSILVVGAGNSGVDVLNHLVCIRTRRLWVAVRGRGSLVPTWLWGVPVHRLSGVVSWLPLQWADRLLVVIEHAAFGELTRVGLSRGSVGSATRLAREGIAPAIDNGFVDALKKGDVAVVPSVANVERNEVILTDQRRLQPDVVICATGYSPGLENMIGHLHVLDAKGIPRFQGAESDAGLPGLWFLGMKPRLCGNFNAARCDSRALARKIARAETRYRQPLKARENR